MPTWEYRPDPLTQVSQGQGVFFEPETRLFNCLGDEDRSLNTDVA
jgi:hypothetical protein